MTKCLNPKRFVRNLFETFNIEPNQKYAEAWNDIFMMFEDAIIDEAWLELIGECKMKYLTDTKTAYRILSSTRTRMYNKNNSDELHKKAKSTPKTPGFHEFYLAVEHASDEAKIADDTNVYWKMMADWWDNEGDKNAAYRHRSRMTA